VNDWRGVYNRSARRTSLSFRTSNFAASRVRDSAVECFSVAVERAIRRYFSGTPLPQESPTGSANESIHMHPADSIAHLSADQIASMFAADLGEITPEQFEAIVDFVDRIGGQENAMLAVDLLRQIEPARDEAA